MKRKICDMNPILMVLGIIFIISNSCQKEEISTITDIDGNIYHSVTIGTQVWMVENLKVTHYNDNTPIPYFSADDDWYGLRTAGYSNYGGIDESYVNTYGRLYNWYAVSSDKLAPKGWHVPSNSEWLKLQRYLISNGYNYDGTTVENKIAKALAASTGWQSSTAAGAPGNTDYQTIINKSGFTAVPGGVRHYMGSFFDAGEIGYWWSSEGSSNTAYIMSILFEENSFDGGVSSMRNGYSVRCIKD